MRFAATVACVTGVAAAGLALLVWTSNSRADDKTPPKNQHLGAVGCILGYSKHTPADHAVSNHDGEDSGTGYVFISTWPEETMEQDFVDATPLQGKPLKKPLRLYGETPFVVFQKDSEALPVQGGGVGYSRVVYQSEKWTRSRKLASAEFRLELNYDGATKLEKTWPGAPNQGGHIYEGTTIQQIYASSGSPLVALFDAGGSPTLDANGYLQFDSLGNVLWDVPPVAIMRFTSSALGPTSGLRTFEYKIENLTSAARTFSFSDVTSAEFPNGWSGQVAANATATLTVTAAESEAFYVQNCQALTDDVAGPPQSNHKGVEVYVPASRLTYAGTHAIVYAAYQSATGRNRIGFTVNAPASIALLYRVDAIGATQVVNAQGPFVPSVTYYLEDEGFLSGENRYWVATGLKANYYSTELEDQVTIEN